MNPDDTIPAPPRADRRPETVVHHGHERVDPYAWLRAHNWQEVMRNPGALPPDIRAYLEAENAYFEARMAHTKALQETLFAEMRGRIKEDDSTVPEPDGPWAYAVRHAEGEQHPLHVRLPREGGEAQVLLDGNALAQGHAYYSLGCAVHSPDHEKLAWSFDDAGSELYTLQVRNLGTGEELGDVVPDTTGEPVWAADSHALFYVRLDANHRPSAVYRHDLGTSTHQDVLVFEEEDPGFFVSVDATQSRRFVVVGTADHDTAELRLLPADQPGAEPVVLAERERGVEYDVEEAHGTLFVLTNAGGAKDFRIVTVPVEGALAHGAELVPHVPGRLILGHVAYAGHLVRLEREHGLPRIVVHRLADGEEHTVAFDEEAYALGLLPGHEFETRTLRFTYASMTTPTRVWDYDMETRERVLRKEQEVPSGHDPEHYVTRRVYAPAPDGERVPVTLLYHRDTPLDGTAPCLLYGYGAYGITVPPSFSVSRLSLVDRGFVYAIAHVRGGKDLGYRWYEMARREGKVHTFTDFIAAAEHLVSEGFTGRGRIVAQGGSAGGLLMGAVANMAPPDLFGGIIAQVPFVDALATMLDDSLPLTPAEWPEWGNPVTREEDYRTILAYSPYDNVEARPYPPMLVMSGLTDPRVTYWEPAKWVARLRELSTGGGPLLLRTNLEAGHAGAAGRFDALRETAIAMAFALEVTGRA